MPGYSGGYVAKSSKTSSSSGSGAPGGASAAGGGGAASGEGVLGEVDEAVSGAAGGAPEYQDGAADGSKSSAAAVPGLGMVGVAGLLAAACLFLRRRSA